MTDLLKFQDPLEELLADALIHSTPPRSKKQRDPAKLSGRFDHKMWADGEENWTHVGGAVLMHKDSGTLLGNFTHYRHIKFPDAEKWLRELEPISVTETKWVEGPHWIATSVLEHQLETARESLPAVIDIYLHELGLRASTVELRVELLWGGINRAELSERTEFHSDDRMRVVFLPKGLDILGGLSTETKVALREEVLPADRDTEESLQGS